MTDDTPNPNRWRALAVCLVGGFIVLLDVSIVNVALPSIRVGLSASDSDLQWVLSGYALTFGLLLVPAGRLGDLRGRRTMFVVALGLFTLASAACGAAPTALFLVIARLIQGLGGGMLTPQISALIQELFSGKERGTAFGAFGAVVGISTAVGPVIGGLLITAFGDTHGWRAVFFVNLPIGIVAMALAWKLLPKHTESRQKRHDLDPIGVVLLGAAAVVLLLPFVQDQTWHTDLKWLLVPAALVLAVTFVLWDKRYAGRGKSPLVDFNLFRLGSYSFGAAKIALYFAGFTPLFFVITLYLQTGRGYSALLAGLSTLPFAVGSGLTAGLGGRIVYRFGRPLVVVGLVLVALGFAACVLAVHLQPDHDTGLVVLAPLLVAGFGSGLVIAPNQTLTLEDVPVQRAGTAGGLLQTGQRVGSAVGIAAVGSAFFSYLASSHGQNYAGSFNRGLYIALAFVGAAFLCALAEGVHERVARGHGSHRAADHSDADHQIVAAGA